MLSGNRHLVERLLAKRSKKDSEEAEISAHAHLFPSTTPVHLIITAEFHLFQFHHLIRCLLPSPYSLPPSPLHLLPIVDEPFADDKP
jgi:hypothetical protein